MAYVTRRGDEVEPIRPMGLTSEAVALARDIVVVRLRRRGASWRAISEFLNTPAMTLKCRYDRMEPDVREYYERTPLDMFGI